MNSGFIYLDNVRISLSESEVELNISKEENKVMFALQIPE